MKKSLIATVLSFFVFYGINGQTDYTKLGLVWDSSYGMVDRNMEAELGYLNEYFLTNSEVEVRLVVFSNTILKEETFLVEGGQWEDLKSVLINTVPDGATQFIGVFPTAVQEIILVTDGRSVNDDLPTTFAHPVTVLLSVPGSNINDLKSLATQSGGSMIDLLSDDQAISTLKKQQEPIQVRGIVTTEQQPLGNVQVYSRENNKTAITDNDGSYSIETVANGIIEFSYIGMKTYMTRVPKSGTKNVNLREGGEALDEVFLTTELKKAPGDMVSVGVSKRSKRTLGYAVETITEEDIGVQDLSIENAIQGQFSNVSLGSDQSIYQFLSRGNNMSMELDQTGLIVVDGVPMESDPEITTGLGGSDKSLLTSAGILDPNNIAEITVLKGLAATNKWGTIGRNGVILITTKNAVPGKPYQRERNATPGTTETYEGGVILANDLPSLAYIVKLELANSKEEAYQVYLQQRNIYGSDPAFFLNAATYFKRWQDNFMIDTILSNISELPDITSEVRTAQAYKYQELGMYSKAIPIYKRNINDQPKEIQHYRNLALAYTLAGQFEDALVMYKRIDRKQIRGITTYDDLQTTIDYEYKNLIARHEDKISLAGINPSSLQNVEMDTRIVFEWNAFDAEFDLQIVNPQQRYFTWSHTEQAIPSRFNKEKELGYGLEEFFMTQEDTGIWLFNMTYYGKRTGDNSLPSYVKITRYDNYGKANQKQLIKVISLEELNKEQTVLQVKI